MKVKDVIQGKIETIFSTHFIVDFKNDWKGLVHISEISDFFVSKINYMFREGEKHYFEVIDVDESAKRVKLSWKSLMPRFEKDPFDFGIEETKNGFSNLINYVKKVVEND